MKIADKTVVQMHYILTSDEGAVIDSSEGREPLQYIQGAHMIVVGLEKAMVGHDVGDKFDVKVIAIDDQNRVKLSRRAVLKERGETDQKQD